LSMKKRHPVRYFALLFGLPAVGGAAVLVWNRGWHWALAWLLSINIMTGLMWIYDKVQSQRRAWRIPENALHLFSLIGGVPAAFLAMFGLRHKTLKKRFTVLYMFLLVLQLGAAFWIGWLRPGS